MRKYFDTVINKSTGLPISGATVSVTDAVGGAIQLYSDDGITPITNPINAVTTNGNGLFQFFVDSGTYSLSYSFAGKSVSVGSVEIYDDAQPSRRFARPVADSTADFRARLASETASGTGYIEAPAGNFKLSVTDGPIAIAGPMQIHFNAQNKITTDNLTGDVFTIQQAVDNGPGQPVVIDGHGARLDVQTGLTKTAGAIFVIGGTAANPYVYNTQIDGFECQHLYRLIEAQNCKFLKVGNNISVLRMVPGRLSVNSGIISLGAQGRPSEFNIGSITAQQPIAENWYDGQPTTFPTFGIRFRHCDAGNIIAPHLVGMGSCLYFNPQAGQTSSIIQVMGGNIDSASRGFNFLPQGGGSVQDITASGAGWCGTHADAGMYADATNGTVQRISLSDYRMRLNTLGLSVVGAVKALTFSGNAVSSTTNEAVLLQGGTDITIRDNLLKAQGDDPANKYGLTVSSGVTGRAVGNIITGNTTADVTNGSGSFTVS